MSKKWGLDKLLEKKLKPEIEDGDYFVCGKGPLEYKRKEQEKQKIDPYSYVIVLIISPNHPSDLMAHAEIGSTKLLRIPNNRLKIEFYERGDKIRVVNGHIECKLPIELRGRIRF